MKRKKLLSIFLMMLTVLIISVNAQAAVKISKKNATLIKGQSITLKVTGTTQKVKWTSSKKAVATVTQKGVVKAKAKGTATISAKVGQKTYKCKVKVETPKINKKAAILNVANKLNLKISGNTQKVKWTTNKKTVATVTQKGVVTAKKAGTAVITATISKKKYKCTIKVLNPITGINLSDSSATLVEGDTYTLKASFTPVDTTDDTNVSWSSSNGSVVQVTNGTLTAISAGTAVITARIGNYAASCTVTVEKHTPTIAENYQYLKQFVSKYGSTNSDGNKFIKITKTDIESTCNFGVVYFASENRLQFIMTYDYNNTVSAMAMYVDTVNNPYVDPVCTVVFCDYEMGYESSAHILASAYNGVDDVYFSLIEKTGSVFTTSSIQDLSNSSLRLAFAGWNTLLQNEVGISLNDLGFSSYQG